MKMKKIITFALIIISACTFSSSLILSTAGSSSINVYEVPPSSVPEGEITITGLEVAQDINVSFSEISTMITNSTLEWYTETISFEGSSYSCGGIDPLQLLDQFNIWYPGNIRFQGRESETIIDAKQIQYGLNPRNGESDPENLKILLCLALDGNWLQDSTEWSSDGPAKLICPSNSLWTYESSDFIKNVNTINITSYYSIPVSLDGNIVGYIDLHNATNTELFNYTSYDIISGGEVLNYAGPTIKSIGEQFGIDLDGITGVSISTVDLSTPYFITWSKFVNGMNDVILAILFEDEPVGYTKGPFRLVGGDLARWEYIKYVWSLDFQTTEKQSSITTPVASTPGFDLSAILLVSIATCGMFSFRKRWQQ
ncbi:MAG: hypothetical protein ACTSRU_03690 [Candidatus Hodarchaeales archaeon]